jgi:hypothetical protein
MAYVGCKKKKRRRNRKRRMTSALGKNRYFIK